MAKAQVTPEKTEKQAHSHFNRLDYEVSLLCRQIEEEIERRKDDKLMRKVTLDGINRKANKLWKQSGKPRLSQAEKENSAEFNDLRFQCAQARGLGFGEYLATLAFGTTGEPPRGI